MNIGKSKNNYNKDKKPRCFNYNIYKHIAKDCQKPKKEKETRKCYECNKIGYLVKNCRLGQRIKNRSIQEKSDEKDSDKEKSFVKGLEQVWYDKPLYIVNSLIDMLFYSKKTTKRRNLICAQMFKYQTERNYGLKYQLTQDAPTLESINNQ